MPRLDSVVFVSCQLRKLLCKWDFGFLLVALELALDFVVGNGLLTCSPADLEAVFDVHYEWFLQVDFEGSVSRVDDDLFWRSEAVEEWKVASDTESRLVNRLFVDICDMTVEKY